MARTRRYSCEDRLSVSKGYIDELTMEAAKVAAFISLTGRTR